MAFRFNLLCNERGIGSINYHSANEIINRDLFWIIHIDIIMKDINSTVERIFEDISFEPKATNCRLIDLF